MHWDGLLVELSGIGIRNSGRGGWAFATFMTEMHNDRKGGRVWVSRNRRLAYHSLTHTKHGRGFEAFDGYES